MIQRFLNPSNHNDVQQLSEILDDFLLNEKQRINPVYIFENQINVVNWIKNTFQTADQNDFIITGQFYEGRLEQIFVAYKLEVVWKISESYWPYWCVGLVYFRQSAWRSPANEILTIEKLATDHFESQKLLKGFMVIKAPKGLIKMTDFSKADDYIDKIFTKTIPGLRHNFVIEGIFRDQQDIDNYQFKGIKPILPRHILSPVILLSFNLKHQHRLSW